MGDTRKLIEIGQLTRLDMGNVGEGKSRMHLIDVSEWQKRWPDASIGVLVERPDGYRYTPATTITDGIMKWVIEKGETTVAGKGLAQIMAVRTEDGFCYKSRIVQTVIQKSLDETVDPEAPEPMETWVNHAIQAAAEADTSAQAAQAAAKDAVAAAGDIAESAKTAVDAAETAANYAIVATANATSALTNANAAAESAKKAANSEQSAEESAQTAEQMAMKARRIPSILRT